MSSAIKNSLRLPVLQVVQQLLHFRLLGRVDELALVDHLLRERLQVGVRVQALQADDLLALLSLAQHRVAQLAQDGRFLKIIFWRLSFWEVAVPLDCCLGCVEERCKAVLLLRK